MTVKAPGCRRLLFCLAGPKPVRGAGDRNAAEQHSKGFRVIGRNEQAASN